MLIPCRNELYDCFDGLVATFCNANGRAYYMAFAHKLFFRCAASATPTIEDLSTYAIDYATQTIEEVHGVSIVNYVFFGRERLYEEANREASHGTPLSLKLDIFDCPWSVLYKKAHIEHEVFVLKDDGDTLTCLDPYNSDEVLRYQITSNKRRFECTKYRICQDRESREICLNSMKSALRICAERVEENYINLIRMFDAIDFENVNVDKLDDFLVNRRLTSLANNRSCYVLLLDSLSQKYECRFDKEKFDLRREADLFGQLRTVLLKSIVKGTVSLKRHRFREILSEISGIEMQVISSLLKNVGNAK